MELLEWKNPVSERTNSLSGLNGRLDFVEEKSIDTAETIHTGAEFTVNWKNLT